MIHYVNGKFVDDADAVVSVTDHSFLYGDGCFEGIGVVDGKIIHLDEHVERLLHSARVLRIPAPMGFDELREVVIETARRNGMDTSPMGYLRPLISRGRGPLGIKWSSRLEGPLLAVIAQMSSRRIALQGEMEILTACVTTQVRAHPATLDARIKSNNYITNVMAYLEAEERGFDVGLVRDAQGLLSEGHAMNVFVVHGDVVRTPARVSALDGITRQHVLAAARGLGYRCEEGPMTLYDLLCSDEAFVTSSLDGVAALSRVDSTTLTEPVPGPVTTRIRNAYVDRALAQGTPVVS